MSCPITDGSREAGPSVQTILALRIRGMRSSLRRTRALRRGAAGFYPSWPAMVAAFSLAVDLEDLVRSPGEDASPALYLGACRGVGHRLHRGAQRAEPSWP